MVRTTPLGRNLQGEKLALELTNADVKAGVRQQLSKRALHETISNEIVLCCTREFGDTLQSIVLTGSLAREEASAILKRDLTVFSSDADCLLVFPAGPHPPAARLTRVALEIRKRLVDAGIEIAIGLAAVAPSYFSKLLPNSYTYELKNCGQVLWGGAEVLSWIPSYSVFQLSKEDAWRTLSNRIIEILMCVTDCASGSTDVSLEADYALT